MIADEARRELIAALVDEAADAYPSSAVGVLDVAEGELRDFFATRLKRRPMAAADSAEIAARAVDEVLGFGPIQPLMEAPGVTDVLINAWDRIYYERAGQIVPFQGRFFDAEHLSAFVHRHVARGGRSVNRAAPWVDVELHDGSRMHVVAAPVAMGGPFVSIRRFPDTPFTLAGLEAAGGLTGEQRAWLEAAVQQRLNLIIAGAPGVGKTTLLGALLGCVPRHERIVLVEDVSEIRIDHPHCLKLQTRRIMHGDAEQASIRKLVRETLRMRPDRLVVGEVRGDEVFDMVTAMSIGLSGSLSTLHAGSVKGAVARLERLYASATAGQSGVDPTGAVNEAVDAVVFLRRDNTGRRGIGEIALLGDSR